MEVGDVGSGRQVARGEHPCSCLQPDLSLQRVREMGGCGMRRVGESALVGSSVPVRWTLSADSGHRSVCRTQGHLQEKQR